MTRTGSAKENALTPKEFRQLVEACERTDQPLEYKFILLMAGRLGMRAGEVAHMKKKWVDFDRGIINIPHHEPCACAYCVERMKQRMKRKKNYKNISPQDVMKERWKPKYPASARAIPFDFDSEVEEVLKAFMSKYEGYPFAPDTLYNWVKRIGKIAGLDVYPHSLRATAATTFGYDGVSLTSIQAIGGWKYPKEVQGYILQSGGRAQEELNRLYRKREKHIKNIPYGILCLTDLGKKLMNRKRQDNEEEQLISLLTTPRKNRFKKKSCIKITEKKYEIYQLLIKKHKNKTQTAKILGIRTQTVDVHVRKLENLGLVKPKDPNSCPKYYKSTSVTPNV